MSLAKHLHKPNKKSRFGLFVNPQKPFVVETNASAIAIGIVLLQDKYTIAFESKKLNLAQCTYSTYKHE